MKPKSRFHQFDWYLFLVIFITLLIVVSLPAISFGIAHLYNNQPTIDEILPQTQYQFTTIDKTDVYDDIDSTNIFLKSVSRYPLNITLHLIGYKFDHEASKFVEYTEKQSIHLLPGHFQEYKSGKYLIYTNAVVNEVIIKPTPTPEVDLSNIVAILMVMLAFDIFCFTVKVKKELVIKPWFYIATCTSITILWFFGFVFLTRNLLTTNVRFCILGIFF